MDIENIVRELNANRLMDADGDATYSVHVNVAERLIFEAQQIGADQQINRLKLIEKERDALRAQLETTKRELTATTISWENAQAELQNQDTLLRASVPAKWKSCTSAVGGAQSYIAELEEMCSPVPAMPMQDDRIAKEWQEIWNPIDELVRPLTPLGHSVAVKAVELIKQALAMPIPKQEPAGVVRDVARYCGHDSLADMVSTHIHVWRTLLQDEIERNESETPFINHELNALADIEGAIKFDLEQPSPRITEQDAREIGLSLLNREGYGRDEAEMQVDDWIKRPAGMGKGIELLNKLNANAVADGEKS